MCLDTATDTNETLIIAPSDNFAADIDLGYEKNFYNELSDCDNKNLYLLFPLYLLNLLFP